MVNLLHTWWSLMWSSVWCVYILLYNLINSDNANANAFNYLLYKLCISYYYLTWIKILNPWTINLWIELFHCFTKNYTQEHGKEVIQVGTPKHDIKNQHLYDKMIYFLYFFHFFIFFLFVLEKDGKTYLNAKKMILTSERNVNHWSKYATLK